jgi:hypothetical protein
MPLKAISITKRIAFRESTQEFTNVYHYETLVPSTVSEATARINEVSDLEKTWHSSAVSFVRGRFWTAGGTKEENQMITQVNLSGTGGTTDVSSLDRERAFLIMWAAGFDSRGKPVFLRKWYHACGNVPGITVSAGHMANTTAFTDTQRSTLATAVNAVRVIGSGAYDLRAESGRAPTGNAVAHKFLEHHQLGDMWRAQ